MCPRNSPRNSTAQPSRAAPARRLRALAAGLLALCLGAHAEAAPRTVDLELVLAADISASVDAQEAALMRRGFAAALRDPLVIDTISSGWLGRIAVTYLEWAGDQYQATVVDWAEVHDRDSAFAVADAIERAAVMVEMWTSISAAIGAAARRFEANGYSGTRRVIDISGDGPNNKGPYVVHARDLAVAAGIVINGLPIVNDRPSPLGFPPLPNLDLYYEDCVIGGQGAFVVVADGFEDFARAIRRKLLLEVAGRTSPAPLLRLAAEKVRPPCDAGEQQLRDWMPDMD